MTRIQKIVSYIIGIIFMLSGIGKALNVFLFQSLIHSYGFAYLDLVAPVIVLVELILSFLFLSLERVKTLSIFGIALIILFTAVYTYGYTQIGITDCGCMGVIRIPDIHPVYVYSRNIILLVLLNYLYFASDNLPTKWSQTRHIVFFLYIVVSMFWAGMSFRPKAFIPQRKHCLENHDAKRTILRNYIPTDKSALVLCYSYECTHCMNTMENFFALQRYNLVDTIIAVAVVQDNTRNDSIVPLIRRYYPQLGEIEILSDSLPQITEFPTSLLIEHDTIKQVVVGEMPNPYLLFTNNSKNQKNENF